MAIETERFNLFSNARHPTLSGVEMTRSVVFEPANYADIYVKANYMKANGPFYQDDAITFRGLQYCTGPQLCVSGDIGINLVPRSTVYAFDD